MDTADLVVAVLMAEWTEKENTGEKNDVKVSDF